MKILNMDLQEILIALALVIIVPTTVYLGCNVIAPFAVDKEYSEKHQKFMKGYSYQDKAKFENRSKEWKKTVEFVAWERVRCRQTFINLLVKGVTSSVAFVTGAFVTMPAISASMVMVGLILYAMYNESFLWCVEYYGVELFWIELLFVITSLIVMLWAAYRDSELT